MKHEYRIVQPYGPDRARQATVVSSHPNRDEAFAEIDRLSSQMMRTGVASDAIELIVVDEDFRIIQRRES